jgi:hypothetical protein
MGIVRKMPHVPSLTVCVITADPPERLRSVLEPVRGLADEIVLGADSRVPEEQRAVYAELADRVPVFEFDHNIERHLAWLHQQCSGDWILRLDGDEVAGAELLEALPELVDDGRIRQYWLPRRWVAPDGRGWFDELPWAPDYQARLVRNDDGLAFPGLPHSGAEPVYPARYLWEPIYHLVCPLVPKDERVVQSLRHELREPLRIAPGGGPFNATYYLPERFSRRVPAALTTRDLELVEAVLRDDR